MWLTLVGANQSSVVHPWLKALRESEAALKADVAKHEKAIAALKAECAKEKEGR